MTPPVTYGKGKGAGAATAAAAAAAAAAGQGAEDKDKDKDKDKGKDKGKGSKGKAAAATTGKDKDEDKDEDKDKDKAAAAASAAVLGNDKEEKEEEEEKGEEEEEKEEEEEEKQKEETKGAKEKKQKKKTKKTIYVDFTLHIGGGRFAGDDAKNLTGKSIYWINLSKAKKSQTQHITEEYECASDVCVSHLKKMLVKDFGESDVRFSAENIDKVKIRAVQDKIVSVITAANSGRANAKHENMQQVSNVPLDDEANLYDVLSKQSDPTKLGIAIIHDVADGASGVGGSGAGKSSIITRTVQQFIQQEKSLYSTSPTRMNDAVAKFDLRDPKAFTILATACIQILSQETIAANVTASSVSVDAEKVIKAWTNGERELPAGLSLRKQDTRRDVYEDQRSSNNDNINNNNNINHGNGRSGPGYGGRDSYGGDGRGNFGDSYGGYGGRNSYGGDGRGNFGDSGPGYGGRDNDRHGSTERQISGRGHGNHNHNSKRPLSPSASNDTNGSKRDKKDEDGKEAEKT